MRRPDADNQLDVDFDGWNDGRACEFSHMAMHVDWAFKREDSSVVHGVSSRSVR